MNREDLAGVPDGETLRRLPSGLEIVRRRKHEPVDFEGRSRNDQARLTDKRFGSKFLQEWNLAWVTDWIADQIVSLEWVAGRPVSADVG